MKNDDDKIAIEDPPEAIWARLIEGFDRAYLKVHDKLRVRESAAQVAVYTVLTLALLYDQRLCAVLLMPLMMASFVSEVWCRSVASERFRMLYDKPTPLTSIVLWPLVWHVFLIAFLLTVIL